MEDSSRRERESVHEYQDQPPLAFQRGDGSEKAKKKMFELNELLVSTLWAEFAVIVINSDHWTYDSYPSTQAFFDCRWT